MPADNVIKLYDDIDAHVEKIVAEEQQLKTKANQDKQATQRELNRLARDKAIHIRQKKLDFHKDPNPRQSLLEWCRDVAGLNGKSSADDYIKSGEMLGRHKFLAGVDASIRVLCTLSSKALNKTEMTSFQNFAITENKPLSEHKIHVWAHEQCGRKLPPKAAKKHSEDLFLDRPIQANTMEGRLKLGYSGNALLGIHLTTPPDVVEIVCKVWAQRYHPDKGVDVEVSQRIQQAIEAIRSK